MKETDYKKTIQTLSRPKLLQLWNNIAAGKASGFQPGKAMEYLIIRAFELEKAEVRWPYAVKLDGEAVEQTDGLVHLDWGSFLIESKDSLWAVPQPNRLEQHLPSRVSLWRAAPRQEEA